MSELSSLRESLFSFQYPEADEIQPGWYSAMSQGHVLSVLTRAYTLNKEQKFLNAAFKALNLFHTKTEEGGIRAEFMKQNTWYEEYPTNPNTFVLNGFMYALLGLHDLKDLLLDQDIKTKFEEVEYLFNDGFKSLKSLLPLFDIGSGSVYDLRHFTMGTEPKVARWDYHSTHINLLYAISTLTDNSEDKKFLLRTAERWRGYMIGNRAKHN